MRFNVAGNNKIYFVRHENCPIFSRQILFQLPNTKFPKNPSGGRRVDTCRQKDRPTGGRRGMRKLIGAFRE